MTCESNTDPMFVPGIGRIVPVLTESHSAATTSLGAMALRRPHWISRWSTDTAAQAGVIGAAWSVAGSLSRGLLPRSPVDQSITTSVTATTNYQLTATMW
jgi:uncharacterized membrane protein